MYEAHWGLTVKPFQLNPDPAFYFSSKQHRRAKAYLDYGVLRNEGFIVITGEIGAGKTTIVRGLIENLNPNSVVVAHLVSTQLDAEDTLRMVGAAFGVRTRDVAKADLLMAIEVFLISQTTQGKRCLLIVDEAQNLKPGAVEELRMLSNFQFGKQALLQSFLIGQPEFRQILQDPSMQQLRQRVIAACHIGSLDLEDTQGYIEHRLKCAGANRQIFDADASQEIFAASGGIPRRINNICDRLLLLGFLANKQMLGRDDVIEVACEIREEVGTVTSTTAAARGSSGSGDALQSLRGEAMALPRELAHALSSQVGDLGHELQADRVQRLERSLLRIERINLEVLTVLQKLLAGAAKAGEEVKS